MLDQLIWSSSIQLTSKIVRVSVFVEHFVNQMLREWVAVNL